MRALGLATPEGTEVPPRRFSGSASPDHFRSWNGLRLSSIGLGTYLGPADEKTDAQYRAATRRALGMGCNVIDTAVNYRHQHSERSVGEALAEAMADGVERRSVFVSTKGGFIPFDGGASLDPTSWIEAHLIRTGVATVDEIAAGCHCMAPRYLKNQLETSLRNLRLEAVDVYYIHNPETQLPIVGRSEFLRRIRAAFELLERAGAEGKLHMYGTATWSGYRHAPSAPDYLSIAELVEAARDVAGDSHRFRAIQLPVNIAMPEAFVLKNQSVDGEALSLLEAASRLGMMVMASGSIYQGQLARGLPAAVADAFPGLASDAQRALQFARSAPGVTTALVGMKTPAHLEENLALAAVPLASREQFSRLFQ